MQKPSYPEQHVGDRIKDFCQILILIRSTPTTSDKVPLYY